MFHHILKISFGQTGFICMKIADSSVVEGKIRKAVSLDCGSEIRNSRFIVFPVHADGTKVEIAFSQVSTLFIGFSEIAFRGFFLFQVHVGRANEEIQFSVLWLCDGIFLKIGESTLKIFKRITADTAGIGNCIGIFRECFFRIVVSGDGIFVVHLLLVTVCDVHQYIRLGWINLVHGFVVGTGFGVFAVFLQKLCPELSCIVEIRGQADSGFQIGHGFIGPV